MKQLSAIITIILLALAGCRQGGVDSPRLVELDSLIAVAPDSAAALLAVYPDDSLRTDDDRAYHALLLTQAKYKAYIPATSDSLINQAVAHYVTDDRGDYDRHIRALIYKGCVMTELGQPDSAMYWFKRAETAARPDDHSNLGYINFRMGDLYQSQFSDASLTVKKYHSSLQHYTQCNDSSRVLQCLMEMGAVYRDENNDSALKYINQAKRLAQELRDSMAYYSCFSVEAYNCYLTGDYATARELTTDALNADIELIDSTRTMMIAAMSLAKLGQADSASMLCSHISVPGDSASQVLYYDMCAQICQAHGDKLGFATNMRQSESIAGDLLSRSLQQQLSDIEKESRLNAAVAESRLARQQSRYVAAIALILILLSAAAVALWQKRQKLNAAIKKDQINRLFFELDELSRANRQLAEKVQSTENDLNDMQCQLDRKQQIIDNTSKRIIALAEDNASLKNEHQKRLRLSRCLEYIAGILHNFIMQSHELKPTEFLNKFRDGFLDTPKGGEADFWYMLRTQVDQIHSGAIEKMLLKHPQLSEKDIQIICMLALGFSSEMMATCLQHKSNYIETLKNRLKKKLGIKCSIVEYLEQFAGTSAEA